MPLVSILLCVFDGKHFLLEQLESIAAQTHKNWKIYVSDDGDCEESIAILEEFKKQHQDERVVILSGPKQGFAKNFMSLACNQSIDSEYYAFCDQDDIWEPDHLSRALDQLNILPAHIPALYSSRTRYISEKNFDLGLSSLFKKPPSFRNALVQSIAGANTMVFNQSARLLINKTPHHVKIVSHDWWTYLLVSGCGGHVHYDSYPSVQYRQHGNNISGQNTTISAKLLRLKGLLMGRFKEANDINLNSLNEMYSYLTFENRQVLSLFSKVQNGSIFSRVYNLYKLGVYRQNFEGNIGLLVAAILRKI